MVVFRQDLAKIPMFQGVARDDHPDIKGKEPPYIVINVNMSTFNEIIDSLIVASSRP